MRRRQFAALLLLMGTLPLRIPAQTISPSEQRTARYLDSIRQQPSMLLAFVRDMPKGGDLHNHLAGAIYAENLIDFAADDGLCVDHTTSFLIAPPCDPCEKFRSKPAVKCAYQDTVLYNSLIDAWSMRNWTSTEESGHDHFFATFDKFFPAFTNHTGDALAEAASRAADDRVQYLELMHTADGMQAPQLAAKIAWDDDLAHMREQLLAAGLRDVVTSTRKTLDQDVARMRSVLQCGAPKADPGCGVTIRFLYQVLRGLPREQVFAQILLGFELASVDPRFVGLNLVMPEDWYVPMHDFALHMKMIDYLHGVYPNVHITLHAGELAKGMVPPEGLRFHIRQSIELGHAERIGHGVSVMEERDPLVLLREMSQRNVLVEICLTSNDEILGVRGMDHPLPVYLHNNVPVALATDDEGVSRSNMTEEYLRAVDGYDLPYSDLKRMARQSLEHSFLPGASLWEETREFHMVIACAADRPDSARLSRACQKLITSSEKADAQWRLEKELADFEKKF